MYSRPTGREYRGADNPDSDPMKYTTHISLDYYVPATGSRHSSVATIRDGKAYAETEWTDGKITSHTIPGILAHRKEAIKRSHARALANATPTRIEF